MPDRELLKEALSKLCMYLQIEINRGICRGAADATINQHEQELKAARELRTALDQQEPVAWADQVSFDQAMRAGKGHDVWPLAGDYETRTGRKLCALYTHPPREWKNLTVDELIDLEQAHASHEKLSRAIEKALKEKNHD